MQLRYVFSETANGLKRNVSMTIALVVTIFVSLTLVGMGLLLNAQAKAAEETWGNKLQVTVMLCNQNSQSPHCSSGEVNDAQKTEIQKVLSTHPDVKSYSYRTKAQAFAIWKRIYVSPRDSTEKAVFSSVTANDMQESYLVNLKDPNKYQGIEDALAGMDGVDHVRDLRDVLNPIYYVMNRLKWGAIGIAAFLLLAGVLQVGNSIRLAAFARRKEIGIMRLVGASTLYISLPFLLEMLAAALIAIVLSAAAIAAVMQFAVYGWLRHNSRVMAWINWHDGLTAVALVAALGVLLTVVPTLFMTRKYLKV
ncbi:MAG TPA: permease-like cell division protein FtsX [Marmoricola sp.]|jgi:cell division transport system permease protein|nr:permease-like cell division protein FtsX [Marmoricola sp.]